MPARTFYAAMAAALLLTKPAVAQQPVDCGKAITTADLNACAEQELAQADAGLNDVYRKVLAKIAASDQPKPYDAKRWEAALRTSQRAWVAFRDADCKGLAPMAMAGGTATTGEVLGCMTELTEARAKSLKDRFEIE